MSTGPRDTSVVLAEGIGTNERREGQGGVSSDRHLSDNTVRVSF